MPHCCSWLEFITSVRRLWLPGYGPLDERDAKVAWSTYAAMPGEYVRAAMPSKETDKRQFVDVGDGQPPIEL